MATLLLIEDSEAQRAQVRAALAESGLFTRILEAPDGISGLKLLLSEPVDLVLCDLEMPGLDGAKLLRMKSAAGGDVGDVPFVVLTAVSDPDRRARLLCAGACDAITKPFHAPDLVARLDLHLRLVRAQNELTRKNRELERLSTTDPLTGLRNRRHLDAVLRTELARSERHGSPLAVVMADIDHFKGVNDRFGHAAGDEVLRRAASVLEENLRVTDCGGRWGGEEFLVILASSSLEGAVVFAERWRARVEDTRVPVGDGREIGVTMSLGVAVWKPGLRSPEALVARADEALYAAKLGGRNQVAGPEDGD